MLRKETVCQRKERKPLAGIPLWPCGQEREETPCRDTFMATRPGKRGNMTDMEKDEKYMQEAIRQAKKAEALMEVPIGCVIVFEDKIIARGYNRRNTDKNTISHAEMNAIRKASRKLGDWRLGGCTMYITLEPCQMCAGAIVQARIPRVVIGSMNPKAGCAGSVLNLLEMKEFNHQVQVTRGVLEEACSQMLSDFFRRLRESRKQDSVQKKWEK